MKLFFLDSKRAGANCVYFLSTGEGIRRGLECSSGWLDTALTCDTRERHKLSGDIISCCRRPAPILNVHPKAAESTVRSYFLSSITILPKFNFLPRDQFLNHSTKIDGVKLYLLILLYYYLRMSIME